MPNNKAEHPARHNPYTCRCLIRIDKILYQLRGKQPYWSLSGKLCINHAQTNSHFPGWMFTLAAWIQNQWFWTRKILSA